MGWVIGFGVMFGLSVLLIVRNARRAGPRQLSPDALNRGHTILSVRAGDASAVWQKLGRLTSADGLKLRFDHDDDPQAEAMLSAPGVDPDAPRSALANNLPITLESDFKTFHVHTGGYVFRIRARGTGKVVGKQTCIQMVIDPGSGKPIGGRIENDDSYDSAVGDWIDIESAEILSVA